MKFRHLACCLLLLAGNTVARAAAPGPETGPVKLTIRPSDSNNVTVERRGDDYVITTTGVDPYVFLDAERPVDVDEYPMLAFNSFNTSGIMSLALFVGQLDNAHLIEGNLYELPRTEGWSSNAYDISCTDTPPAGPVSWIRIRFGMNGGNKFTISGLQLRAMNDRDRDILGNIERRDREDREQCDRLAAYLKTSFPSSVTHVEVSYPESKVTVEGILKGKPDAAVGLAEIPMWEDYTALKETGEFLPLAKAGKFRFTLPRFAADKHDRLLSGWAVVRRTAGGYELLSAVHYPDDITPREKLRKVTATSLKGIGGGPFDHEDMVELGVGGANFNIMLNEILFPDPAPGRKPYEYCGRTWYVDENSHAIRLLDLNARKAKEHGWLISAILLLPLDRDFTPGTWMMEAAHPERQGSAAFAMPNILSRTGLEAYAATMTYLCERYSSEERGRIHHWIVHNEIQNGFYWANAGDRRMLSYMNLYQKSMRTVYNIARQYDPNAQVLVSMDHDWNRKSNKRSYEGRDLLNILVDFCRQEGDFQWAVAFHPYPQDINNPRTWEDDQATYRFDTPFLTPKNLEVLNAWVELPEVRYRGLPREIHFTEQGLNSPDYSEKSLLDQAAGMAYTWEKIRKMKNVKCYYYHLWADDHGEGGLRLGLRKFWDYADDPLGKKPIWDVVRAFETPEWEKVSEPYKAVIGVEDWDEIRYKGKIE